MAEFYDVVATILTFLTFGVMFFGLAIVILIKDIEKIGQNINVIQQLYLL